MADRLSALARTWDSLAKTDPLWSILRADDKVGNRWDLRDFLETGRSEVDTLLSRAQSKGFQLNRRAALDFGCGVGRLSQALAANFEEVAGVDISPTMIDLARQINQFGTRCHYFTNCQENLRLFEDESFDFIYSNKVLQHMHPDIARSYLAEFLRVMSPAGLLVFQLPSHIKLSHRVLAGVRGTTPKWAVTLYRRLRASGPPPYEMHAIPRAEVERWLVDRGGRLLEVSQNREAGPAWVSLQYWVAKD